MNAKNPTAYHFELHIRRVNSHWKNRSPRKTWEEMDFTSPIQKIGFSLCWNASRFYGEKFGNDIYTLDTHPILKFKRSFFRKDILFPVHPFGGHRNRLFRQRLSWFRWSQSTPGMDHSGVHFQGCLRRQVQYGSPLFITEWIYLYTQHIGQQLLTFTTTLSQTYSYLHFFTATLHNYWLGTFFSLFLVPHVAEARFVRCLRGVCV